tara:strand:- start:8900 stop:9121 length:222 start_codon:yes stop_codon:yes gene_type:complete
MNTTSNTTDLRRSSIMPGKGQLYKKSMKHGGKEEMSEMKGNKYRGGKKEEMAEMKPMKKKKPAKKAAAKKKGK